MPALGTAVRFANVLGLLSVGIAGYVDAQTVNRARSDESTWREGPLDSPVDWTLFPKAYGILASERLMRPVDLADWPVKIGPARQLFLDNYLVASAANVRRTVHQPVKHSANPVLEGISINEGGTRLILLQADRDRDTGKFQIWYTIRYEFTFPGTNTLGRFPTLYAESSDAVNWRRPDLGLLEVSGSRHNNWVLYGRMYGLMENPDQRDPARRYLAAVLHEPPYAKEGLIGEELWFFYRGSRNLAPEGTDDWIFAVGLAKLRRDGFVSIDTGTEPGTLATRPLTIAGEILHVNAAASGGSIRIGLADTDGKPLPGFGIDDCKPLSGDGTDQIVQWRGERDFSEAVAQAEHIRLQFVMTGAELCSFWID